MTTPAPPNPISLANIQAEFGGPSSPISITSYYANGTLVPLYLGPPASGTISMSSFRGISNYTTYQTTQSGINTGTGSYVGFNGPDYQGRYGPYPVRSLDALAWHTTFAVASLTIYQEAYIDYGYSIYICINGAWNTSPICAITDPAGGQHTVSGTSTVSYSIPAGAYVTFGFSTGPYWQQILSSGICTVTFNRA